MNNTIKSINNHFKKSIILFDGECNLCNGIVQFIIKIDKTKKFAFASLQSASGQKLLKDYNLSTVKFNTFILVMEDKYFIKSTAGLNILRELGGVWNIFFIFRIIPISWRDFVYELVANNRHKLFGRRNKCLVPTSEIMQRFLP